MEEQISTKKGKTLLSFFKKRDHQTSESTPIPSLQNQSSEFTSPSPGIETSASPSSNLECQWSSCIERDPGKRKQICEYPVNVRDEIRRAYLLAGPYQPSLLSYKKTKFGNQRRSFQKNWFNQFKWLEYSPSEDKAYCFYCFLFLSDSNTANMSTLATVGFDNWKRVNQGDKCAFLTHIGSSPSSPHLNCVRMAEDLMKPSQHIERVIHAQSKEESEKNRLRLRASVIAVRLLALQGCAFRGHDESSSSLNRGNFIQMLKAFAQLSTEVDKVVLDNAPKNAQYIAPNIQKDILNIMANRVRKMIREDVGDECFCILVDEAKDASNREQLAIILRFVNSCGILTERFFAIKSVSNTTSLNLKNEISDILVRHDLQLSKMRGQGYDGANNMRGTWNGLQALFLRDYPSAYYVHCFAHRLQLALISAAKDVGVIWEFFSHLDNVINIINSSSQRISELQSAQRKEVEHMLSIGERETGSGANQIGNLQRAGATRWSSHYDSVKSMVDMYSATCKVLEYLQVHCPKGSARAEVRGAYRHFACFEFVFNLLLMHRIMRITDILCQALQKKSLDILAAMRYVSTAKLIIQELRETGWEEFLQEVKDFCSAHNIDVPELDSSYLIGRCRGETTVEHHYHFDVFNEAIDFALMELSIRFNDKSVELLSLSVALDPKNSFESFNSDDICTLARKFYPEDFSSQDIRTLEYELRYYVHDVIPDQRFQVSTLVELCQELTKSRRSDTYVMIMRLIRLVLTLPVSTATTERAFSAMKLLKTTLRNKMEDDFLADCMTLYIERELTLSIDVDSVVDEFFISKPRRAQV